MISACVPAVFRNHAKLLLEPWCFTVAQVGRLTNEQVEHLYLRPMGRVSDLLKRQSGSDSGPTTEPAFSFDGIDTYDHFRAVMKAKWPDKTDESIRESWARFKGE